MWAPSFRSRRRRAPERRDETQERFRAQTERTFAEIRAKTERVNLLSRRLRQLGEELGEIMQRIERDDPLMLPGQRDKGRTS